LPKQNRPLVRDGRLQAKKKRTDRSYLRPGPSEAAPEPDEAPASSDDLEAPPESAVDEITAPETAAPADPTMPPARGTSRPTARSATQARPAVPSAARPTPTRVPTSVRAIQQQGVRKRREFDVQSLAVRDTQYAIHELRRIAILATMVVVTLIVLGIVLR
jgi:hypothetical protein